MTEGKRFGKPTTEDVVAGTAARVGSAAKIAAALGSEQGQKLLGKLGAIPVASAGAIGLAIAAGLAAYGLTTAVIQKYQAKKEGRQQLAFEASQAYRYARQDLAERKGRDLTRPELDLLSQRFKAELKKLGLTTTKLF